LAVLLVCLVSPVLGQPEQASLRDQVDNLREGKVLKSTIAQANNLLPLVREAKDSALISDLLLWLSDYHTDMGDYGKGMEMGVEAATIAGNMGDARRIATAELHIGDVHYRSGNYTRALNTLEPLIETYKVLGDTLQAGKVEANAALNYYALWGKDPDTYRGYKDTTIHQLLRARSTICTHGTPQDRLIVDQLLGGLYAAEGRPEQGLPYNEQSLEIILASRDSLKYAPAYGNLAYNYQELDRFDEALILYDSALYYSRLFEQDATIHILLEDMSKGYQETSEQKVLTLEKEAQLRSNRMLLIAGGLLFSLLVGSRQTERTHGNGPGKH